MALRTATQDGNFSDTATWGGNPVPVSGDTIAANSSARIVTVDVDQSGFAAGLGASTWIGTLQFKRTGAGPYYLKLNGNLSGTGKIDASDGAGGAYPSGTVGGLIFNSTSVNCTLSGIHNIICLEPARKYVKLTQNESAAATVLHVDNDVSGETTYWKNGDLVRVDDINQAAESEQYTISSVTSTTITLTTGLTNAKNSGAYVVLVTRNFKITGAGTGGSIAISGAGTGSNIAAEIRAVATALSGGTNWTIGGSITGVTTGMTGGASHTINASISGATTGISASNSCILNSTVTGCTGGASACNTLLHALAAIIAGCASGYSTGQSCMVLGTVAGCGSGIQTGINFILIGASILTCTSGINGGGGHRLLNVTFSGNTRDLNAVASADIRDTAWSGTIEFNLYTNTSRNIADYVESLNHNDVAGALRAWCKGGITSSVATPVYDASRPRSYNAVPESATNYAFMQRRILVPAGASLYVHCYVRKDASMANLPRVWVFDEGKEPLVSGSPNAESIMTDSVNTWEILEATITNTTDSDYPYIVRCLCRGIEGANVYFDPIIRVSSYAYSMGDAA